MSNQRKRRFNARYTAAPRYDEQEVIGLPRAAMVITNSERKAAWCPRRWWFAKGLNLGSSSNVAMRFGSCFDDAMGFILSYYKKHPGKTYSVRGLDVCPSCSGDGCDICLESGLGCFKLVEELTTESFYSSAGLMTDEQVTEMKDLFKRLRRSLEGWLLTYDESMSQEYDVVAIQLQLAAPIISPSGNIYRSKVPVVRTEEGWRLASAWDSMDNVEEVTLPWYQIGKLDGLVRERRTGKLKTWETKTSANPERFSKDLLLDSQLPGYTRAVWYATTQLGLFGGEPPAGWIWDVSSSAYQEDPRVLKSGETSTAARQRVPSWRWRSHMKAQGMSFSRQEILLNIRFYKEQLSSCSAVINDLKRKSKMASRTKTKASIKEEIVEMTLMDKLYADHLKRAETNLKALTLLNQSVSSVDKSLYHRVWGNHTPRQLAEYESELYADASLFGSWLRNLPGTASFDQGTRDIVASTWKRSPFCRGSGNWCSFTSICIEDSAHGRAAFERKDNIRWLTKESFNLHYKE